MEVTPQRYAAEIAPERTFGFDYELDQIRDMGLIRGASLENAVCFSRDAVGRRKRRQESEGFAAAVAKTAANPDPIVVLIMSLFAPAPMADDGILHANRAVAQNDSRARIGPIRFDHVISSALC
jgi:hypothetical protein